MLKPTRRTKRLWKTFKIPIKIVIIPHHQIFESLIEGWTGGLVDFHLHLIILRVSWRTDKFHLLISILLILPPNYNKSMISIPPNYPQWETLKKKKKWRIDKICKSPQRRSWGLVNLHLLVSRRAAWAVAVYIARKMLQNKCVTKRFCVVWSWCSLQLCDEKMLWSMILIYRYIDNMILM